MRRFAFIEVRNPNDDAYTTLIRGEIVEQDGALREQVEGILTSLLPLRDIKALGPAIFIDATKMARERCLLGPVQDGDLLLEVFHAFFLAQFEGVTDEEAAALYKRLAPMAGERASDLRQLMVDALGVRLPVKKNESADTIE